ncbi:MAG: RNA methyltransferase [Lachnospiraceae bacterium]|nr:RNA methyltransferase [Lachnospiraceae bacterium]
MNRLLSEIVRYQKKASARKEDGVFLIEGPKMFREAPMDRMKTAVFSESGAKAYAELLSEARSYERADGSRIFVSVVKDSEFERISDTKTPQGVLAVLRRYEYTEEEVLSDPKGLYLILNAVQDPGNVGTIFRSAEAAGASGLLLDRGTAEAYHPKVVRATMGSIFRMKFGIVEDAAKAVEAIRKRGGKVFASHLQGSVPYDEADYRGLSAIIVGNESKGISKELAETADARVRIPMYGKTESLNVAMASTVLLYEALRQRTKA